MHWLTNMACSTCLTCCFLDNKVHPLENVLDLTDVTLEETFALHDMSYSSQSDQLNLYLNSSSVHPISVSSKMTRMDSLDTGTTVSGHRNQANITPIHAASINGDKSSLAKILLSVPRDLDSGDKFGRTPLMYCVLGDRMECAEMLIKANADVNKKDLGGRTALHWAAHKGNLRCLKLLLNKGASWKEKDHEGLTALHLSTRHKSPKCLALLMKQLEIGEVDDQDKNKRTCLHWAGSYGNLAHVQMLIKADSNIGIPDIDGKTPLHWAASCKDPEAVHCVSLILETTPSVINWQDYEGRSALHLAVAEGNEAVVNALTSLEKCNVSALDNMFRTPLHWAAVLGHSSIAKMLLERNADFASSDSNGATPLHYAAQNSFAETVEVFLAHKTMQDWPDNEGRSAFLWAASKGADEVINVFIRHNVDMQQSDKHGGTALHAAALAGHASTVKLLLDNKAQINATDLLKHTPLFRVCEMGHVDVVQTLIDCGAHVDVMDQDGRSPLHWAALGGHAYICQTLIKFGIDPNIRDHSGRTPLQCAAYGGFVNCMSVLIESKAEPNCHDNEGMTALHWACSKGHLDSVKLLIEFHAFPNHMEFTEDRYTPLDYALMGEHLDVSQYLVEQGGLSITGIQDIAALKIQATFRGYRVRKTFLERKQLLMKHEQLRKDAAKKKAEEEYKKKEDLRNKREVEERRKTENERHIDLEGRETRHDSESLPSPHIATARTNLQEMLASSHEHLAPLSSREKEAGMAEDEERDKEVSFHEGHQSSETRRGVAHKKSTTTKRSYRKKKGPVLTEEEVILARKREKEAIIKEERERLEEIRRKIKAATVIQRAWRRWYYGKKGVWKKARQTMTERRLAAGESEWIRQIAALTIQLCWRKYYRRKLLKSLTPKNRRILHMWDPEVIALKQKALIGKVYEEKISVPQWYPRLRPAARPTWFKFIPSSAAVSYNYAMGQYHPLNSMKPNRDRHTWSHYQFPEDTQDTCSPEHYSYNHYK